MTHFLSLTRACLCVVLVCAVGLLVLLLVPPRPLFPCVARCVFSMGMGFGMGMFVGGSVTLLHAVTSKQGINAATIKRAVAGGSAFGVIFAVGSLVRPH